MLILTVIWSKPIGGRGRNEPEYELLNTGIFNEDRYFDVFVEYAKAASSDILIKITLCNRGPAAATLYLLPTLWFRNTWTWWPEQPKPSPREAAGRGGIGRIHATHSGLGDYTLHCESNPPLLFTENETNNERVFAKPNATPYVKDAINNYVLAGRRDAVNPNRTGTKAAAYYQINVAAGGTSVIRLRLSNGIIADPFGNQFDQIVEQRRREADGFYQAKDAARHWA